MRKVNKRRYLLAFIISAAIFFIGFFFGFLMDLQRINYFQEVNDVNQINIRSLQLQSEWVKSSTGPNQCAASRVIFNKAIIELEQNRERLELYDQQSKVRSTDFEMLKRQYTLSQINFLIIAKNLKEFCPNSSDFVTVIYFYSDNAKCPECADQATVLNYYKTLLKENLLIFAIDEQLESQEPIIGILKQTYGVSSYPTLVVGDTVLNTYVDKEKMRSILCTDYNATYPELGCSMP